MKRERVIDATEDGSYLNIEVTTGAKSTGMVGTDEWRGSLKVNIAAQPVEGQANAEIVRLFESKFPEARGRIVLVKGGKSRSKRLFIPLDGKLIRSRLGLSDDE